MTIIHIPGETADQIGIWLPDTRVLLCADDLYRAFPNLYAIRGVTPRDVMDWAESLDKMRQLRPLCLVGSHSKPLCGEQKVYDLLSDYMYGIQYVHDQTVRYINKGWHPDAIAKKVKLPPELAKHSHLMQYYGTVHWSTKAVYTMYMGWFSGEAVDLDPISPGDRAERMTKLVSKSGLLKAAAAALQSEDYQWALELATHVHRLEPDDTRTKQIRRDAMARLAEQQVTK
jgi:alkyl sulfatase BDS1-like metallo-beta-lactamase superfamily hydrolase